MKKTTLMIIAIIVSIVLSQTTLNGQNSKTWILKNQAKKHHAEKFKKQNHKHHTSWSDLFSEKNHKGINDIKQKLDNAFSEMWNESTSQWQYDYSEECEYDEKGNNTLHTQSQWDETSNEWQYIWQTEFEYDNSGNLVLLLDREWDEISSQWLSVWKIIATYDNNGNMTEELEYEWDEAFQWVYEAKTEFIYNSEGLVISSIGYDWISESSTWVKTIKYEYQYDGYGNEILSTLSQWNENNNQWYDVIYNDSDYDENNNLIFETWYYWEDNQWEEEDASAYTYNSNNKLILEEYLIWFFEHWFTISMWEYNYDSHGNLISEINLNWSDDLQDYEPEFKQEYFYNNSYSYNELILPWIYRIYDETEIRFNHMLTNFFGYVYNDNAWSEDLHNTFNYSEINIDAINKYSITNYEIFPNPFSKSINIRTMLNQSKNITIDIYNQFGEKVDNIVMENPQVKQQITWYAGNFPSGIYFCVIKTNEEVQTKKIIKL